MFIASIVLMTLCSCVSVNKGEISVSGERSQTQENLALVESAVVKLEAAATKQQSDIVQARQTITSMEKLAVADADFSGKLLAWSGRLAIIEGRYSEAQRLFRQSSAASAGNVPAVILGVRLEGDPARRFEIVERELAFTGQLSSAAGYGELQIERARSLFELNRFAEAAGSFDAAFSAPIAGVYRESYLSTRDQAWNLRSASGVNTGTLNTLTRETISWNDCLTLAKNETGLLRFITGGRDISNTEVFNRLVDRAFIPNIQDINSAWPAARPKIDETVTRAGAAWFIWHLYAEARADRGLLTRYSSRYSTGQNPRSPIADVPPLSLFFDSILGCVETEFLSLPDGRNFNPAQMIRGAELLLVLRKIDN